jgi:hypothetical protein
MKPTTIRDIRDQIPFTPFELHLADGRIVPVLTPDHIMISPTNDEFAIYEGDGTLRIVDGKRVTSIRKRSRKR